MIWFLASGVWQRNLSFFNSHSVYMAASVFSTTTVEKRSLAVKYLGKYVYFLGLIMEISYVLVGLDGDTIGVHKPEKKKHALRVESMFPESPPSIIA